MASAVEILSQQDPKAAKKAVAAKVNGAIVDLSRGTGPQRCARAGAARIG
jgi:hypothetical protein